MKEPNIRKPDSVWITLHRLKGLVCLPVLRDEAAQSMGATPFQIICRVMIPEALPSLVNGAAIATTTILGYSAMAGAVGGGGLGVIAINYGYHRYQSDVMLVTIILLVIIVQILQWIGTTLANRLDKKKV